MVFVIGRPRRENHSTNILLLIQFNSLFYQQPIIQFLSAVMVASFSPGIHTPLQSTYHQQDQCPPFQLPLFHNQIMTLAGNPTTGLEATRCMLGLLHRPMTGTSSPIRLHVESATCSLYRYMLGLDQFDSIDRFVLFTSPLPRLLNRCG